MHLRNLILSCTTVLALGMFASLSARPGGVTPGFNGIPVDVVRAMPACGGSVCHPAQPNSFGLVQTDLTVGSTSIPLGGAVPLQFRALGGVQPALYAGFCIEATAGTFSPGANCQNGRTDPPAFQVVPNVLTHRNNTFRTWDARYNAPPTPGPVEWYAVANTVDNFTNTNDSWDFWQPPALHGTPGIPFRLYVNAAGVDSQGAGCPGTLQLAPVVGAPVAPTLGNAGFAVAVTNVPFQALVLGTLGTSNQSFAGIPLPLDLAVAGAPGCLLRNDLIVTRAAVASGGGPTPGGGVASIPWPLPQDPSLRGGQVFLQALVVDLAANALGITTSAGLRATLQ
jgi:hypothetical protein